MNDPTDEQLHIIAAASTTPANLLLNAYAGCGKTTTLEMIEKAIDTRPCLYLVFNKKNAEAAKDRMLSTTTVKTFNGCGHGIWQKAVGKTLRLDPKKSQTLLREIIDEAPKPARNEIWSSYWDIINGVAMAKALGYVPEGKFPHAKRLCTQAAFHSSLDEVPDDLTSDLIDALLCRSITASYSGSIDYNDQIYMPALFGGTFPQFPLVLADEAQDLSPINHAMLDKLARKRLIAVGDPWQNIYGFRGAKANGMGEIATRYATTSLDLSVSFRCPKAIVENARWRVPGFRWIKEGGHVEVLDKLPITDIADNATIISRNNAPILRLGFSLLAAGRGVAISGSDIGPKLVALMKKLGDPSTSKATLLGLITDWESERTAKSSKSASDLAGCMRVFAEHGTNLGQAIAYAEHLFAQKGTIRLMTGHKAKGLEFDTVYHLDPWLCDGSEQDKNLQYVIETRSRDRYFEIDSRGIQ